MAPINCTVYRKFAVFFFLWILTCTFFFFLVAFPAEINCCSGLGTRTASDTSLAEHQWQRHLCPPSCDLNPTGASTILKQLLHTVHLEQMETLQRLKGELRLCSLSAFFRDILVPSRMQPGKELGLSRQC